MTFDGFCDGCWRELAEKGEGKSAAACGDGGLRCKKEWLKKTSNGIRSFALRRNNPINMFWSSGDVPGGILREGEGD